MSRIGCAVLGATGTVGQRFVQLLQGHPTFALRSVVASEGREGRAYGADVEWRLDGGVPEDAAALSLESVDSLLGRDDVRVVFSALPGRIAGPVESRLADAGFALFTNASDHRMDPDVPLLIPEINPEDLALVKGKQGFIVANGNCSGIILALALAPLQRAYGIQHVEVTTMQAVSGAGHPGVSSLDILDNIIPLIQGEEEKLAKEPQKTLGADFTVAATCTRVPVSDGHFESVVVRLRQAPADAGEVAACFAGFRGPDSIMGLPSAPGRPIHFLEGDRPQPRRDRDLEGGMAISVGRLRLEGDMLRFVVLGHNTLRGAAGQSILNAEFAAAAGYL